MGRVGVPRLVQHFRGCAESTFCVSYLVQQKPVSAPNEIVYVHRNSRLDLLIQPGHDPFRL